MYNSYVHNATQSHQRFPVWHSILPPNPKRRHFALFSVSILLLWIQRTLGNRKLVVYRIITQIISGLPDYQQKFIGLADLQQIIRLADYQQINGLADYQKISCSTVYQLNSGLADFQQINGLANYIQINGSLNISQLVVY